MRFEELLQPTHRPNANIDQHQLGFFQFCTFSIQIQAQKEIPISTFPKSAQIEKNLIRNLTEATQSPLYD